MERELIVNGIGPAGQVEGLTSPWPFSPSRNAWSVHFAARARGLISARRRPAHALLKAPKKAPRWLVYFIFLPDSELKAHHHFTLRRLRETGIPLMIICASPSAQSVPEALSHFSDALYWKAMPGYDFSAYTLALEQIAEHSSGADTIIMNDSMFGPFHNLVPFVDSAPWDLTGFTASRSDENHIQSYAFILKAVSRTRIEALRSVLFHRFAFNRVHQVIAIQELRLARIAARKLSVGAFWYADGKSVSDPCLQRPFELLDAGFPFMKRSLLGKMRAFQQAERVIEGLHFRGHPV